MRKWIEGLHSTRIDYQGPGPEQGPLPAFFYFALSAEESLDLPPYNQPAIHLTDAPIRVFSFTLPGHGEGFDKHHAMHYWAEQLMDGNQLLEEFFDNVIQNIHWLIKEQLVDAHHMATGGLSRGGFVAAHIAAKEPRIHTLLGFAPLTELSRLKEFSDKADQKKRVSQLDLINLIPQFAHVHAIRFYMGNHDTRVSTDACYRLVRKLAEQQHEKRMRHQSIEMMITQSIGHGGHGTAPAFFKEGALWVKQHLLGLA